MSFRGWITRRAHQAHGRTLIKTLLYRVFMVVVTVTVAFAVTGSATDAVSIGLATNATKTATYYCYERGWAHVSWGTDPI